MPPRVGRHFFTRAETKERGDFRGGSSSRRIVVSSNLQTRRRSVVFDCRWNCCNQAITPTTVTRITERHDIPAQNDARMVLTESAIQSW